MHSLNRPPLKLVFGTPEFLPAGVVQSTVRVGQKWRDDLNGKVAPRIPCVDLEGTVLGTATVVGSLYGSFKDFAYIGANVNHQENCRDVDGLIDVLKECYPDFNPETNVVTVIFFKYAPVTPVAVEEETEEVSEDSSETDPAEDENSDDSSDDTVTESGNDIAQRVSNKDSSDESSSETVTEESSGEEVDKTESETKETS